jgi:carboxypeptidase C (cathepsin A)
VIKQGSDKLEPIPNPYAWNAHANMLFIESPPGVGFSINKDPNYNKYNDSRTAEDNLNSLRQFFKKFP